MHSTENIRRVHARQIWQAGVDAVRPERCLPPALAQLDALWPDWSQAGQMLVVGGGKAGSAMTLAWETALAERGLAARITGWVNVPDDPFRQSAAAAVRSVLHPARPTGTNSPTAAAVAATEQILRLAQTAADDCLAFCLLSGGGSALLVAPPPPLTLADKQRITQVLSATGATIQELNTVRKHLSVIKGGGLARTFFAPGLARRRLVSLIISDVIGDPLDVIASGPTAVDPTTFSDALAVLAQRCPEHRASDPSLQAVWDYLERGSRGQHPETLKTLPGGPAHHHHAIVASNRQALAAAAEAARRLGYPVVDLGSNWAGDTLALAKRLVDALPTWPRPACVLSGGETTMTLPAQPGLGGRNQALVLEMVRRLGSSGLAGVTVLSGGTDGEDGPTNAAGALADADLAHAAQSRGMDPAAFLDRADAYHFFAPLGGLLHTGLTQTNVMDLRVLLLV